MLPFPQQVRIVDGGLWHQRRQDNGRDQMKCGERIPQDLIPATRDYKLDNQICEGCHTPYEVETGRINVLLKEDAKYPADLPVSKRPSTEERRALKRRELEAKDTLRDLPPSGAVLDDGDDRDE